MVGIHLPGLDSISNKDGIAARDSLPKSMSLPGLGLSTQQEEEVVLPAYHVLKEGSEWRFEVSFDSRIEVKVQPSTYYTIFSKVNADFFLSFFLAMQSSSVQSWRSSSRTSSRE